MSTQFSIELLAKQIKLLADQNTDVSERLRTTSANVDARSVTTQEAFEGFQRMLIEFQKNVSADFADIRKELDDLAADLRGVPAPLPNVKQLPFNPRRKEG